MQTPIRPFLLVPFAAAAVLGACAGSDGTLPNASDFIPDGGFSTATPTVPPPAATTPYTAPVVTAAPTATATATPTATPTATAVSDAGAGSCDPAFCVTPKTGDACCTSGGKCGYTTGGSCVEEPTSQRDR